MYRPEGFYKLLAEMPNDNKGNLIEFVADAMLEGLKKDTAPLRKYGFRRDEKHAGWFVPDEAALKGYLVFIPEEA